MRWITIALLSIFVQGGLAHAATLQWLAKEEATLDSQIAEGHYEAWILVRKSHPTKTGSMIDGVIVAPPKLKLKFRNVRRRDGDHTFQLTHYYGKPGTPIKTLKVYKPMIDKEDFRVVRLVMGTGREKTVFLHLPRTAKIASQDVREGVQLLVQRREVADKSS